MKQKEKIFFVYPPSVIMNREDRCQMPIGDLVAMPMLPPFDMMSLSAVAKKRGYETRFKDYSIHNENVHDFIRDIRDYKPDFLVINVASTTLENDLSILKEASDLLDETVVIAKGSIFNFSSYSICQKYPEIDIALRGEIEQAFDEIIQYKNLKDIKGITYQVNNKIISTTDRPVLPDIDNLPFLDRELIDNSIYVRPDNNKPCTVIRVSKGCPYECFVCLASGLNGKNIRYRSVNLIIDEIKQCVEKYNIKDFVFWSDIFNVDNEWVQKLCRAIIEAKLGITFCANTRVDTIDKETLRLMKQAGCEILTIGIESASNEILEKMGKKITVEQIKNAVDTINKAGIMIYAYYVIGLPWETKQTIEETYKLACELNTQYANFYTAAALIGTKFYDYSIKNRLGEINYEKPYIFPTVNGYNLTNQEVFEYNKKFNKNYYLRVEYILKMVKNINSITKLKNYFNTFINLTNN